MSPIFAKTLLEIYQQKLFLTKLKDSIMEEVRKEGALSDGLVKIVTTPLTRKNFLIWTGASAALAALGVAGCKTDPITSTGEVNLGSGDTGVLNYAYALEQLEAAFYIKVAESFYSGASNEERLVLTDIRDHEIAHREFFKAALGSAAIRSLEVDFSTIDFNSRTSVLGTAKAFEDLGVSAYNSAGFILESSTFLGIAGKIVSVEARHASVIRDLLNPKSMDFSGDDVVSPSTGLDVQRKPSQVLPIAQTYIRTRITANNLP